MRTSLKRKQSLKNQCELIYIQRNKDDPLNKKNNMQVLNMGENNLSKKYNVFNIMDKSKVKASSPDSISSNDENDNEMDEGKMNDKELAAFRKKKQYSHSFQE